MRFTDRNMNYHITSLYDALMTAHGHIVPLLLDLKHGTRINHYARIITSTINHTTHGLIALMRPSLRMIDILKHELIKIIDILSQSANNITIRESPFDWS